LLNSSGVDCGVLAALPLSAGAGAVVASDGGIVELGAATELEVDPAESSAGDGGASAFLQPASAAARHAQMKTERVTDRLDMTIS